MGEGARQGMRRFSHFAIPVRVLIALLPMCAPSLYGIEANRNLAQYVHRIWQSQPGLPQAPIFSIAQDRDGFIWLGTQNGVVRFDGVRFSSVAALDRHPLSDPWVSNLVTDSSGRVWIRTNDERLARVSGEEVRTIQAADGLPGGKATCLASAADGGVWVCTPTGLAHFQGDKVQFRPARDGKFKNTPSRVCETKEHVVWAGSTDASDLYIWNGKNYSIRTLSSVPATAGIRALRCTDGVVWIGTDLGLIQIKGDQERRFEEKNGLPDDFDISLGDTRGDDLWIGTRRGLSRFRNSEFSNYGALDGLSQSTVFAIFEDREGSIWVGTKNGLNQFVDSETVLYTTSDGLPSNNMGPVLEDKNGTLWGGTLGGGLFSYINGTFHTFGQRDGLGSDTVIALVEQPGTGTDSVLWVGTKNGLNRFRNGRLEAIFTQQHGLPSAEIHALRFDKANVLWVATAHGVARMAGDRFVPLSTEKELQESVTALGQATDGSLLFATEHGALYLSDGGKIKKLVERDTLRELQVIYTDPEGYVWLGTFGGGLVLWKDGKPTRITMQDGLPDGQIFDMLADGPDRFWIACSSGYYSVSRKNLLDFASGRVKKITGTAFNSTLRLRTIESQADVTPAVWKSHDGQLWFSTIRGLLRFDPARWNQESGPMQPVIDEVEVSGEVVKPGDIERLPPGNNNVTFHYTALSLLHPEQWRFRYMLQGYDTTWINAGTRREAFYTNLPPGEYRFQVVACESDTDCAEQSASVRFSLAPHWYQHAWFFPACVLAVALIIWGAYRMRLSALRHEVLLVVGERNRIARELHDTLIQGFSGITMQLQALSGRLKNRDERDALGEIIQDAGNCLQETRRSVAGLRAQVPGGSGLAAALCEAARHITEQRDVRLRLNVADRRYDIPAEVKYNLVRIAQEAITNAVKHSGARTIEVDLNQSQEAVQLLIIDDGRGFSRDGDSRAEPLHYGIVGMRERANQIGGRFQLSSAPGRGTQVTVSVPLQSRPEVAEIEETV